MGGKEGRGEEGRGRKDQNFFVRGFVLFFLLILFYVCFCFCLQILLETEKGVRERRRVGRRRLELGSWRDGGFVLIAAAEEVSEVLAEKKIVDFVSERSHRIFTSEEKIYSVECKCHKNSEYIYGRRDVEKGGGDNKTKPVEFLSSSTQKPPRVLFVATYHHYLTMMDRWFFQLLESASLLSWDVHIIGEGFPNFSVYSTFNENLYEVFGDQPFDLILVHWSHISSSKYNYRYFKSNLSSQTIFAILEHEWEKDCQTRFETLEPELIFMTYIDLYEWNPPLRFWSRGGHREDESEMMNMSDMIIRKPKFATAFSPHGVHPCCFSPPQIMAREEGGGGGGGGNGKIIECRRNASLLSSFKVDDKKTNSGGEEKEKVTLSDLFLGKILSTDHSKSSTSFSSNSSNSSIFSFSSNSSSSSSSSSSVQNICSTSLDVIMRPIDLYLIGRPFPLYPSRMVFAEIYESNIRGLRSRIHRYDHPGYIELIVSEGSETPQHLTEAVAQYSSYLQLMQKSKICLIGTRNRNYVLRKYLEAMASGCLVVGDWTHNEEVNSVIVGLNYSEAQTEWHTEEEDGRDKDKVKRIAPIIANQLIDILERYRRGEYDEKIQRAYRLGLQRYSYTSILKYWIWPAVEEYRDHGKRGIIRLDYFNKKIFSDLDGKKRDQMQIDYSLYDRKLFSRTSSFILVDWRENLFMKIWDLLYFVGFLTWVSVAFVGMVLFLFIKKSFRGRGWDKKQ